MNPLLLPVLLALLGSLWDSAPEPPEAYARPQTTIANYWHCMLERRHLSALECFVHYTPADANAMLSLPDMVELRCRDFKVADRGRGIVDVTYTVEYRNTAPAGGWQTLTNLPAWGTNSMREVTDPAIALPQRYYRLRTP